MSRFGFLAFHVVLIFISIVVIAQIFPLIHYFGGFYFSVEKSDIEKRALSIIEEMEVDPGDHDMQIRIRTSRNIYQHIIREHGIVEGNKIIRDKVPAFYWDIRWTGSFVDDIIAAAESEDYAVVDARTPDLRAPISLSLSGRGNLLSFEVRIADSLFIESIDSAQALETAKEFLSGTAGIDPATLSFISHNEALHEVRTDHILTWSGPTELADIPGEVTVRIAGNRVVNYNLNYNVPRHATLSTVETVNVLTSVLPYVIIGIGMVVILFRRIRSHEIGFKYGIILGIAMGLLVGVNLYLQLMQEFTVLMLIPIILGPIFVGAGAVFVWITSEAVGRETSREKFITLDLLFNGHVLHSRIGESVIRGIGSGFMLCAFYLVMLWIVNHISPVWYIWSGDNPVEAYSPPLPGFRIFLGTFYSGFFPLMMLIVFMYSILAPRINKKSILFLVISLVFGLGYWSMILPPVTGITVTVVAGFVLAWLYHRHDVLTSLITISIFILVYKSLPLFFSDNTYFIGEGITIAGIVFFVTGLAVVSLATKDRVTDFSSIAPAFQRYISERERLQRELEIAHEVQMSFLPKENPNIPTLDIAGRCIPAHEVGGDYYDFISINDHLFGVVIGDVSGKGTKASFYMTLTKGILRSTARNTTNPAQVLTNVNRTFYEIAERGSFISMVYGIFNLKENNLTLARAGHNPVILWKSSSTNSELLHPKGIALGLDPGNLFNDSIHEMKVQYGPGDVFIFYTDGFSEANNKKYEEFGDERLLRSLQKSKFLSAEKLLGNIINETITFTGRTPQRDDMTMIVVRITDESGMKEYGDA
jgi:phosphoserine phosphatase RsbU/P